MSSLKPLHRTKLKMLCGEGTDLLIQPIHQLKSSFGTFTHHSHPTSTSKRWIFLLLINLSLRRRNRVQKMPVDFGEVFCAAPFFLLPSPCANIAKVKN